MKSRYEFEIKESYLLLNVTGTYDLTELLSLPAGVKARCEEEGIFKVLLNCLSLQNTNISTTDRFYLGEKLAQEFKSHIILAVVWPARDIDRFAETVALNRGGNMYVTGNYAEAEEWLLKSEVQ